MRHLRAIFQRLATALGRSRLKRDLEDELAFHLAMWKAEHTKAGVAPKQAETAGRRQFGSTAFLKEQAREQWAFPRLETCAQDLRFAIRVLRRSPAFTTAALFILALGMSTTITVFSFLNAVLLRPLPFRDPERLVQVYGTPAIRGEAVDNLDTYRQQSA